jgi:THO complex subunit 2
LYGHEAEAFDVSVIGYFDLDPSRTLDLILDIFISNFISHHRFFVDLLRCSTWGPSSASSPSTTSDATIPQNSDEAGGKEGGEEEEAELDRETGSTVAAQILGLKFQHYQEQTVMRAGEETPREMYLVAAIMVKQGLIKLKELWNHVCLSPPRSHTLPMRLRL